VKPEVLIGDTQTLRDRLVVDFDAQGRYALSARGVFTVALSGGSLATQFFPALARLAFDWTRTQFFWADERAVPPDDPESNYGIARALWLEPANVPPANVHRLRGEDPDVEKAARDQAEELVEIAGTLPKLDLILLGAGPDGHVASLFPGHPAAAEEERLVVAVDHSPKPPPRRLTMTLPVLANAARTVVVAFGEEKAAAIHDALEGTASTPLAALAKRARNLRFMLDEGAASLLSDAVE
jgi:6-phosphogluconolactonase